MPLPKVESCNNFGSYTLVLYASFLVYFMSCYFYRRIRLPDSIMVWTMLLPKVQWTDQGVEDNHETFRMEQ